MTTPLWKISSEQMHENIDFICHDIIPIKPYGSMQICLWETNEEFTDKKLQENWSQHMKTFLNFH